MSSDQIAYLLKLSCLSRKDIINAISNNYSNVNNKFCIRLIKQQSQDGVVHIGRERIKRVFMDVLNNNNNNNNIQKISSRYCSVGWVLGYDQKQCLQCLSVFTQYRRQHHCRACGNLICSNCSSQRTLVEELERLGKVRVCNECFENITINDENQSVVKLFESINSWGDVLIKWDNHSNSSKIDENQSSQIIINSESYIDDIQELSSYFHDEYFVGGVINDHNEIESEMDDELESPKKN